jgi:hypothetical protein
LKIQKGPVKTVSANSTRWTIRIYSITRRKSAMLVLRLDIVSNVRIQRVMKAQQSLADGFTRTNHRFQYCNRYCSDDGTYGTLNLSLVMKQVETSLIDSPHSPTSRKLPWEQPVLFAQQN